MQSVEFSENSLKFLIPETGSLNALTTVEYKLKSIIIDIFNKCVPVPGDREIIVSGYVLADGKGDYFHMLSLIRTIKKLFPQRKIHLIAASDVRHINKLPQLNSQICTSHIIFNGEAAALFPTQPPTTPELFTTTDVLKKAKDSAVIISGPINLFQTFDSIKDQITSKKLKFCEYGGDEQNDGTNKIILQTGFDPTALGIFTKKKKNFSLKDLENEKLKHFLFDTTDPSLEEIQNYLTAHEIFLCYVSRNCALTKFIDHCIACTANQENSKAIDIFYPSKNCIHVLETLINDHEVEKKEYWKERGVALIQIIYYEDNTKKVVDIGLGGNGKVIRIIDVGVFSSRDFNILVSCTHPLMGCTGDTSFAAALCYEKLPFYEVGNKTSLLKELIDFSHRTLNADSEYAKYLTTLLKDPFETILAILGAKINIRYYHEYPDLRDVFFEGKELCDLQGDLEALQKDDALSFLLKPSLESLFSQAKKVGAAVREQLSLKPKLRGIINECLCRDQYPQFALKEDQLIKSYLDNTLTEQEFTTGIEAELVKLGLVKKAETHIAAKD